MVVFKLIIKHQTLLFELQQRLSKWRQLFIKYGFEKPVFLSNSSKCCVVWNIRFCLNLNQHVIQIFLKERMERL